MRKLALIYNPQAGKLQRSSNALEQAMRLVSPMGEVSPYPTTGPNTAAAIARARIDAGDEMIIAFGGDGTINEVANGMVGSHVPLAPLPGGTANVLCVEVGFGTSIESAARKLRGAEPVRIALGKATTGQGSRYFLCMAGAGMDAMVVEQVNPRVKAKLGKVAYWLGGLSMFGRSLPAFEAEQDGATSRHSFILASRVKNYGGDMEIARRVSLRDPHLETVSFSGGNTIYYVPYMAALLVRQLHRIPGVSFADVNKVVCNAVPGQRVPVHADGEFIGVLPATFEVVQDSLTILLPPAYGRNGHG